MIQLRSILLLTLLSLMAAAPPRAVAAVFGPDMPGWSPTTAPAPVPAVEEKQPDRDPLSPS